MFSEAFRPQEIVELNIEAENLLTIIEELPSKKTNLREAMSCTMSMVTNQVIEIHSKKWVDEDKIVHAIYFEHNGRELGWFYSNYSKFDKFVSSIYKNKIISKQISVEIIETFIFEWLKNTHKQRLSIKFSDYLFEECDKIIDFHEIWIPIANLDVQNEILFEDIKLKKLSKEQIEKWITYDILEHPNKQKVIIEGYVKRIAQYVETTFAIYLIKAEKRKSYENAYAATEIFLSVLHFYSKIIKNPKAVSYTNLQGLENLKSTKHFIVKGSKFVTPSEQAISDVTYLKLTDELLNSYRSQGYDKLIKLFSGINLTEYETLLLHSIKIYLKSCYSVEIEYKLILIFAALESILVTKDEAKERTLGERMALMIGSNLRDKKDIIQNVIAAYRIRSNFIHSALTNIDNNCLTLFFENAWTLFSNLLENKKNFQSKLEISEYFKATRLGENI